MLNYSKNVDKKFSERKSRYLIVQRVRLGDNVHAVVRAYRHPVTSDVDTRSYPQSIPSVRLLFFERYRFERSSRFERLSGSFQNRFNDFANALIATWSFETCSTLKQELHDNYFRRHYYRFEHPLHYSTHT